MLRVTIPKWYVNMDCSVRWTAYKCNCLENILESSGWAGALVQADVPTSGKADSFFWKHHTSSQQDEPSLCLATIIGKGSPRTCEFNPVQHWAKRMEDWCTVQQETKSMFKLWFLVLQRQLTILVCVRSIRSGSLPMYIQSSTKLIHWFFTLDHYVRRISVHLLDMMTLSHLHPHIYADFVRGHFTVKKTSHAFSNMAT